MKVRHWMKGIPLERILKALLLAGGVMASLLTLAGCTSTSDYYKTASYVDMDRFMGEWFVIAGRFTYFEEGAHNAVETYKYNREKKKIEIGFRFNKDSLDGEVKEIPQSGWIHNTSTNAHWKVSPMWPLKFDYLILDRAEDYSGRQWVSPIKNIFGLWHAQQSLETKVLLDGTSIYNSIATPNSKSSLSLILFNE